MKEACVHGSALRLLQNNDIGGRFLDDTEALKFQLADYRCLSVFPEPGARVSMNLLMQRLSETSVVNAKFLRSKAFVIASAAKQSRRQHTDVARIAASPCGLLTRKRNTISPQCVGGTPPFSYRAGRPQAGGKFAITGFLLGTRTPVLAADPC